MGPEEEEPDAGEHTTTYWRRTADGRTQVYPCASDQAPPCQAFVDVEGTLCGRCYLEVRRGVQEP